MTGITTSMTSSLPASSPTSDSDTELQDRLARLQQRRAAGSAGSKRPSTTTGRTAGSTQPVRTGARRAHPAKGARVAAAGFGLAGMLGLVGAMAINQQATTVGATFAPVTSPPAQIVVVLHQNGTATQVPVSVGSGATLVSTEGPATPMANPTQVNPTPAVLSPSAPAPIALTAKQVAAPKAAVSKPAVRKTAAKPVAKSRGSR